MTVTMTATELKAKLLAVLDDVSASGEDVIVTKHGREVARIVPSRGPHALLGMFAGRVRVVDPDDDLVDTGIDWPDPDWPEP